MGEFSNSFGSESRWVGEEVTLVTDQSLDAQLFDVWHPEREDVVVDDRKRGLDGKILPIEYRRFLAFANRWIEPQMTRFDFPIKFKSGRADNQSWQPFWVSFQSH